MTYTYTTYYTRACSLIIVSCLLTLCTTQIMRSTRQPSSANQAAPIIAASAEKKVGHLPETTMKEPRHDAIPVSKDKILTARKKQKHRKLVARTITDQNKLVASASSPDTLANATSNDLLDDTQKQLFELGSILKN